MEDPELKKSRINTCPMLTVLERGGGGLLASLSLGDRWSW